jgi:peptidoglycan/LPS O-acetylase OafA/YrhL
VPAYWAVLAVIVILTVIVPLDPQFPFPSLANVGVHLTFMQMPFRLFPSWHGVVGFGRDGALWTMSLEVIFYIVLPFVAASYFRRPLLGLLIAAAITLVWQEALVHGATVRDLIGNVRLRRQFPEYAFAFGAGMTGAWSYVHLRERFPPAFLARRVAAVQVISLVTLGLCCYVRGFGRLGQGLLDRNSPVIVLGFTASLATLMVATALGSRRWQRPFAHPFARWLGDISYGMYLIHLVIINYAIRLFTDPAPLQGPFELRGNGSLATFIGLTAVVLPLTVMYGYMSGRFLEQPIRRWAQRYGRREQAAADARAAAKA